MKFIFAVLILVCCYAVSSFAQWANPSPVRGQFGQMTTTKMSSIPNFVLPSIYSDRAAHPLPAVVNHETDAAAKAYMPPTSWSIDSWSCSNASGVSFSYDYAVQTFNKITTASVGKDPLFTFNYTYNFTYNPNAQDGYYYAGDGWNYVESFDILKATGGATSSDFGGFMGAVEQTASWMSGYNKYYSAMKVRVDEYYKIDMAAAGADEMVKQIVYDNADGSPAGAILSLMANSEEMPTTTVGGRGNTFTGLGGGGGHALSICGYDNNFNGGCWQIQAHWGRGDYWLPYGMLHSGSAWYNNPSPNKYAMFCRIKKNYTPKFTFKVNLAHSQRGQICIMVGAANSTTATVPSVSKDFGNAFNYSGGTLPMCGGGKSSSIEIGFDLTDFASVVAAGQGTFFLRVLSKGGGTGKVDSLTLMDYNGSAVRAIRCSQSNVAISSSTVLSVPWTGTVSTEIEKKTIALHQGNGLLATYSPFSRSVQFSFPSGNARQAVLQIKDLSGRTVMAKNCSSISSGNTATESWDMKNFFGQKVARGTYIASVNITNRNGTTRQLATKVAVVD